MAVKQEVSKKALHTLAQKLPLASEAKPTTAAVRTGAEAAAAATVITKEKAIATKASQKRASGTGLAKVKAGGVAQARR